MMSRQLCDNNTTRRHHPSQILLYLVSNFPDKTQKNAYFTLFVAICCKFWVFFVIFGCKILVFKNPASVKEMTNMRYEV